LLKAVISLNIDHYGGLGLQRPELLIPAGNLEKLRTAVLYGADAVYVGAAGLSLRAGQAEFGVADLETGVREAHQKGVKVYAAVNVFARNKDLAVARRTIEQLGDIRIDGVILSDPGLLSIIRKMSPNLAIHLSTQANTTNIEAVRFWETQGIRRIVLARELTLAEIGEIAAEVSGVELELFIHGAMCIAYSGRCFLSALQTGRSSNHGECTQPCRWEYLLYESTRPAEPLVLEEDQRYSYLLSSKDLCMIEYLPEVMAAGITSLKVEGRMKSVYYVAVVTRTYRSALDAFIKNPAAYQCLPGWTAELAKISNRGYTTGFYFAGGNQIVETEPRVKYYQTHDLVGTVLQYQPETSRILVGVRNRLSSDDEIELLLPRDTIRLDAARMTDLSGLPLKQAHNGFQIYLPFDQEAPAGAIIRRAIHGS
jgi:putative protease